jgi:hypothetical protein
MRGHHMEFCTISGDWMNLGSGKLMWPLRITSDELGQCFALKPLICLSSIFDTRYGSNPEGRAWTGKRCAICTAREIRTQRNGENGSWKRTGPFIRHMDGWENGLRAKRAWFRSCTYTAFESEKIMTLTPVDIAMLDRFKNIFKAKQATSKERIKSQMDAQVVHGKGNPQEQRG